MTAPRVIFGPAGATETVAARHLRQSFAQRHVPLPAGLADALARFLTAGQPLRDPVWGRAFSCMSRSLGVSGSFAGQLLMKRVLDRFLVVVAEPVLGHAARMAGELPLPVTGPPGEGDAQRAAAAEAAILRHAAAALAEPQVMGHAFWVHAAVDLHLAALHQAQQRARADAVTAPPRADAALAALMFLYEPTFDSARHVDQFRQKARKVSARRRAGIRPKEGGVAGIRPSRSLEDVPDLMFSELAQPRALFANKLLNDGLLVRHRPPRRDPKRDLLAITVSHAAADDGLGTLVKAAWADSAIRLQLALHQMGLGKSDLVWSDGAGPPAHLDCAIEDPGLDRLPVLSLAGKARADRLMRSTLMPGFAARPVDGPAATEGDPLRRAIRRAVAAAGGARETQAIAGDYGRRLVVVCQKVRGRQAPDWAALRADHVAACGRDLGPCHHAGLFWIGKGENPSDLVAVADGREETVMHLPAPTAADRKTALAAFLGDLSFWILSVTLEALDGG